MFSIKRVFIQTIKISSQIEGLFLNIKGKYSNLKLLAKTVLNHISFLVLFIETGHPSETKK